MPTLENFVAVDWRAGPDRCYFFFKDINKYSRFDIGSNQVPDGYPEDIKASNWDNFHPHANNLRFGFSTTGFKPTSPDIDGVDSDILWLFYYDDDRPMVCRYDQDTDKVASMDRIEDSPWHQLLPYFNRIVAGTWWQLPGRVRLFRFLMNDGNSITLDLIRKKLTLEAITDKSWPGLQPYKNRIITAVQNDRTFADSYYYIFLTHNEYIRYNIQENRALSGPITVNDVSWPGLLRD
jgi:hypothetical protein